MRIYSILAVIVAAPHAWAVDPAPLPKEIRTAKTLFIVNRGIEPGTMDIVYSEIKKWPRWKISDDRSDADLIVVLTSQQTVAGLYGNTTRVGTGTSAVVVPVVAQTRYLIVADPKSREILLTLSCRHREIDGDSRTGKRLVNLFKGRFPKNER